MDELLKEGQLSLFRDQDVPSECCYQCEHFAEFKEARTYSNRDGEFGVFGMCFKGFGKNGSYAVYPIYVPGGKCKGFLKKRKKYKEI